MPWAIIAAILKTGLSVIDQFTSIVEGIEYTSSLITRYTIIEKIYIDEDGELVTRFRDSIKRLYATILAYLAKVKAYVTGNRWSTCSQLGEDESCVSIMEKPY